MTETESLFGRLILLFLLLWSFGFCILARLRRVNFEFSASGFEFSDLTDTISVKVLLTGHGHLAKFLFTGSLKRFHADVNIRYMALPAVSPRGVLHPNCRHRSRPDMTCDTIASHLKFMRNGRRRSGQFGPAQTGRRDTAPVNVDEQCFAGHRYMALPAGLMFRMGRDRGMPF